MHPTMTPGSIYDLSALPTATAGAIVVATVAYPEPKFEHKRTETANRLAGRFKLNGTDGMERWLPTADDPTVSLPIEFRSLRGGIKALDRRLRRRLDVGRIALGPLIAADRGERPRHVWGARWNRSGSILAACEALGISQPKNFENRWWRTTLPVLHLAAEWQAMLIKGDLAGEPRQLVDRLLFDRGHLGALLQGAEALETLAERSELAIPPQSLIRFRLKN